MGPPVVVRDLDAINRAVSLTVGGVARGDHVRDQRGQRARRLVVARKKHVGLRRSTAVHQRSIAAPHVATGHLWLRETARHSAALFAQTRLREQCNVRLWSDEALTKHRLSVSTHSKALRGPSVGSNATGRPTAARRLHAMECAVASSGVKQCSWVQRVRCVCDAPTRSRARSRMRARTRTHMHSSRAHSCTRRPTHTL